MATQDFLDGGFYGKVGDVVGYRVNNKRAIRKYVVPANPKTPDQVANRALFATATRLSQEAMNINGRDPMWAQTTRTEFSARVSTAMKRLLGGATEAEAFPLYPDGYIPSRVLTHFTTIPVSTNLLRIYFEEDTLPAGAILNIDMVYNSMANGPGFQIAHTDTLTSARNWLELPMNWRDIVYDSQPVISAASTPAGSQIIEASLSPVTLPSDFKGVNYGTFGAGTADDVEISTIGIIIEYSPHPAEDDNFSYWSALVLNPDGSVFWKHSEKTESGAIVEIIASEYGVEFPLGGYAIVFISWGNQDNNTSYFIVPQGAVLQG
jgi:hypothetical protein